MHCTEKEGRRGESEGGNWGLWFPPQSQKHCPALPVLGCEKSVGGGSRSRPLSDDGRFAARAPAEFSHGPVAWTPPTSLAPVGGSPVELGLPVHRSGNFIWMFVISMGYKLAARVDVGLDGPQLPSIRAVFFKPITQCCMRPWHSRRAWTERSHL